MSMKSGSGLGVQVLALLERNFILKRKMFKQTLQEVLSPIYFVLLLVLVRRAVPPSVQPAVPVFPQHGIQQYSTPHHLLVSPHTAAVMEVMEDVISQLPDTQIQYFATASEAETFYRHNSTVHVTAGIHFHSDMNYTIRMQNGVIPATTSLLASAALCRITTILDPTCPSSQYLYSGFSRLQLTIDTALIKQASGARELSSVSVSSQQLPLPAHHSDITYIQALASVYFVLAYAPFVSCLLVNLVSEKEKKIKEGMRMMGMRDAAFWISWGLTYVVIIFLASALVVLLAWYMEFYSSSSNMFLLITLLFLYGMSVITMAFMLTPFFHKAQQAGAVGGLAVLMFSLLYLPVSLTRESGPDGPTSSIPASAQWALCLLSPAALALAIDQSLYLDMQRGGMTWSTIGVGQFPLQNCLLMLFIDVLLYALLAVYLDNVVPGEYGQRKAVYFFLLPSYWCGEKVSSEERSHLLPAARDSGTHVALQDINSTHYEPVAGHLAGKNVIRICNVKKTFKSGKKTTKAVNGFSLDIYEGQITCLLGHNGAGKTTLINILTGMTEATEGTVTIYGHDVSSISGLAAVRQQTGVCPQHDILHDVLTCAQHLTLFAKIKGVLAKNMKREIEDALEHVDLSEQIHTEASKLSGGQKRKLSVAMALIGDPKVLFLDEPTAGMDPYSRRHLWSLLKQRRPGRVILLTTHFMDEADILADRKAFMSCGRLQCVGSSLFLKNRFGLGYHLGLVIGSGVDIDAITQLVTSHIPSATVTRNHGNELMYTLPLDSVPCFAGLFSSLEAAAAVGGGGETTAHSLGIASYGVSMTTLEEVFMKIGIMEEGDGEQGEKAEEDDPNIMSPLLAGSPVSSVPGSPSHVVISTVDRFNDTGASDGESCKKEDLETQQLWALVKIRFLLLLRNKSLVFMRLVMPLIFIIIGLCIGKYYSKPLVQAQSPALELNTALYGGGPGNSSSPAVLYQQEDQVGSGGVDFVSALESCGVSVVEGNTSQQLTAYNMGLQVYTMSVNNKKVDTEVTAQYNSTAIHSLPVTINLLSNSLLHLLSPASPSISTSSLPWPDQDHRNALVPRGLAGQEGGVGGGAFGATLIIGMAVVFLPAGLAVTVVIERQSKVRSQLRVCGVSVGTYWSAVFFSDAAQFLLVCAVCQVLVVAFQVPVFMHGGALLCLGLLLLVYVPVMLFFAYCLSFAFSTMETATTYLSNIIFFGAFIPYLLVGLLDMFHQSQAAATLHLLASLLDPPYALYGGLLYIERLYFIQAFFHGPQVHIPIAEYFKWSNHIIITIIAPLVQCVWLFFLLRYQEVRQHGGKLTDVCYFGARQRTRTCAPTQNTDVPEDEDEDVRRERERVERIMTGEPGEKESVIVLHQLRKEFGGGGKCRCPSAASPRVAVRNTSLAVGMGEVVGLLGPNGAGKTTTLNCMIAEEGPTAGTVRIGGEEVRSTLSATFRSLGYCPQHDPLWQDITLREHLTCYAAIKGVPYQRIQRLIDSVMESLRITEHSDKISKKLSGGTKRKLSYALSMVGGPALVLLDEPSTGMDPQSKRFLWDTISSAFREGQERGAVLTTHYMEEADALCSRVAIMVNGQLQCLGSTQHLKDRHGSGYVLEVKLGQHHGNQEEEEEEEEEDEHEEFCRAVENLFPGASLVERFGDRVTFKITQDSVSSLSTVFTWFEEGREKYGIEEYSFSQATLEQIFLELAKQQGDNMNTETPAPAPAAS